MAGHGDPRGVNLIADITVEQLSRLVPRAIFYACHFTKRGRSTTSITQLYLQSLHLEIDDEYHFIRPGKSSPYEWPFTFHIISDLLRAPPNPVQHAAFIAESPESPSRRCPYLVTNLGGVNMPPMLLCQDTQVAFYPDHVSREIEVVALPTDVEVNVY